MYVLVSWLIRRIKDSYIVNSLTGALLLALLSACQYIYTVTVTEFQNPANLVCGKQIAAEDMPAGVTCGYATLINSARKVIGVLPAEEFINVSHPAYGRP